MHGRRGQIYQENDPDSSESWSKKIEFVPLLTIYAAWIHKEQDSSSKS